jgi:hypothetical protein
MLLITLSVLAFFGLSLILKKYAVTTIYGCILAAVLLVIMYICTQTMHNEYALFAAIFVARGFWLTYHLE